jgi:hypothetical protein
MSRTLEEFAERGLSMKCTLLLILLLFPLSTVQANSSAKQTMNPDAALSHEMLWAVQADDTAEALRLLAQGADPNVRDDEADMPDMTALLWAAANGNPELVQALLKRGADIKARDSVGLNVLMITLQSGYGLGDSLYDNYRAVLRVLLQYGAGANRVEVNAQDNYGTTPLMQIAKAGDAPTMRLLVAHGAPVNAADKTGKTALMIAAQNGHPGVVESLLQAGANVHARDKGGKTALDWLSEPIVIEGWYVGSGNLDSEAIKKSNEAEVNKIEEGRGKVKELLSRAVTQRKETHGHHSK